MAKEAADRWSVSRRGVPLFGPRRSGVALKHANEERWSGRSTRLAEFGGRCRRRPGLYSVAGREEQVRAVIGAVFLLLSVMRVVGAVKDLLGNES